jgi:hypothetical protein
MESLHRPSHDRYGGLGAHAWRNGSLERGPTASFPTCHFFCALVFPVRLPKIHDDFRHLKARCETFLAHFRNIFAGSDPRFLGGDSPTSLVALELAPFTDVEFRFPALVSNMLLCSLRANWSDASASDGIRTAGT